MTHHELHPLCTLFPRLSGVESDSTHYTGTRSDGMAIADFRPSNDFPGFWDGSVCDAAEGVQEVTQRPMNREGIALMLDRAGGRENWALVAYEAPLRESVSVGSIYFIQAETGGAVKVGWTSSRSAESRLQQLQCGNPNKLRIVRLIENASQGDERALHKRFSSLRVLNEWFDASVLEEVGDVA